MNFSLLTKVKSKSQKRVGRGSGTGKSKTSGRGQKGQKARGKITLGHPHYEGGQRSIIKRLPYRRGKGNPKISEKPVLIGLSNLEKLPAGSVVDIELLVKNNLVTEDAKARGVKILANGQIKKSLTIKIPVSKTAKQAIEKAKGKVEK